MSDQNIRFGPTENVIVNIQPADHDPAEIGLSGRPIIRKRQRHKRITVPVVAAMVQAAWHRHRWALGDRTAQTFEDSPRHVQVLGCNSIIAHMLKPEMCREPESNHDSFRKRLIKDGWEYGPMCDPNNRLHDQIADFERLSDDLKFLYQSTGNVLKQWVPRLIDEIGA